MKEIFKFLRQLKRNNNREWFEAHKDEYRKVQAKWYEFCQELINQISEFDPEIGKLTMRDCTYRIYRDTRFSNDKTPYKTHFGVFLAPGGKKSMHAGYYFHVGTNDDGGYPAEHMLASGNYCYDPQVIKMVREDIYDEWEDFNKDVLQVANTAFKVDMDGALKRVPREYPADAPCADWLRLKNFCLVMNVDDEFILSPNLAQRVAELFKTTKPFNDFINRAVDFKG